MSRSREGETETVPFKQGHDYAGGGARVALGIGDGQALGGWVKDRLRSAKTPDAIVFRAELPKTDTGKLLRRVLLAELEENSHA